MDLAMTGKKAIVTGASEGIGKAITLAFAREGVDVAICARRKEPLEATAAEIAKATGRKIFAIPADLTKPADAERLHQKSARRAGADRHSRQQCRLVARRRARTFDRGGLGAIAAAQIHGLCALHEARAADHAAAEERPRRQSHRQRRREGLVLGDRARRRQRGGAEFDAVARQPIRQGQYQLRRRQSRPGAHRALGRPGQGDGARHELRRSRRRTRRRRPASRSAASPNARRSPTSSLIWRRISPSSSTAP